MPQNCTLIPYLPLLFLLTDRSIHVRQNTKELEHLPTLTDKHTNEESSLTCCSSCEESWQIPSCAGWESPPWQQQRLCLVQVRLRCLLPLPSFTSVSPPDSLAQLQSSATHCSSWLTSYYLTKRPLLFPLSQTLLMLYGASSALHVNGDKSRLLALLPKLHHLPLSLSFKTHTRTHPRPIALPFGERQRG